MTRWYQDQRLFRALLLLVFLLSSLHVQAADEARRLREMRIGIDHAEHAYLQASSNEEGDRLWKVYAQTNDAGIPLILELVRQDVASPSAFESIEWVLTSRRIAAGARVLRPYALQAAELLRGRHDETNSSVGKVCSAIGRNWDWKDQATTDFLRAVAEKNPDLAARAQATFALARLAKSEGESIQFYQNAKAFGTKVQTNEMIAALERANSEAVPTALQRAEELFESVVQKYPAITNLFSLSGKSECLGVLAERELHELRHLAVGRVAPEIQSEDLNGQMLKLSDYRGRVVVLSFWATWCGPCMQMIPKERVLVDRMAGKPFVLLGVNGDENREKATAAVKKEEISWRSFWDQGDKGPISRSWNVKGWPTVVILDTNGVIRFRDPPDLEKAVDFVLANPGALPKTQL